MRLLLALVALVGCRRASDERLPEDRSNAPVNDDGWVEHELPSIGLPSPTAGPIGTAHPTTLVAAAENGRWVVACQARVDTDGDGDIEVRVGHHGDLYGDFPRPYLFRGGGVGQAIQELVAVSPDERWLAIMRGGELVLIDDTNGRETKIVDADLRPDQRGYSRIASFDGGSNRLIYFRADAPGTIVIRDLAQPREQTVRVPNARLWRVVAESVTESPQWARVYFVRDDTDKNGTLDWPTVNTNAPIGDVCRGPAMSSTTFGGGGDDIVDAWLDLQHPTVYEGAAVLAHAYADSTVLAHVWQAPIVRMADRSIRVGPTTIVPARCDASVGFVLATPVRLGVVCKGTDERLPVEIFGEDFHVTLDATSQRRDDHRPPRMLTSPIFCHGDACWNLVVGKRIAMKGTKVEIFGAALLSRDNDKMYWMASPSATPVHVPNIDGYYANAMAGSMIALDKGIVDLATGRVLGYAPDGPLGYRPKTPLAIDTRGRVLVAEDETGGGLPLGPLRWTEPQSTLPRD